MKRLDQVLVEWGWAPTRSKAQQMISAGEVQVLTPGGWITATRASLRTGEGPQFVRVVPNSNTLRYVSRGGLKLESALDRLQLNPSGWRCCDIGISTGGFTDCLRQRGAAAVLGVDVGHDQLHANVRADPAVLALEGVHVRDMVSDPRVQRWMRGGIQLCVGDLSFISVGSVLPELSRLLPLETLLLLLVKPQFEVGAAHLDKRGIVRNTQLYDDVKSRVLRGLEKCGFSSLNYFPCEVKGQDGNQEFFAYARRC
ncbi:MAG: TlyA family RNA methyltransferase [Bdellovibrionales bacterium]